jgi:hypothetical protein
VARDSIYYSQFTIHHFSAPGSQYTLKPKQDGQGAVLKNMPQGKKLKDTDSNRVLTTLTDLRFADVKKKCETVKRSDGETVNRQTVQPSNRPTV